MNYKKKSLLISFTLILLINILLLINNNEKTSFRYFIWNIQEVAMGRLIFASFFTGLLMSTLLNKTQKNIISNSPIIDEVDKTAQENYSVKREVNEEPNEITPERDLRDPQPTISVNYRVIKNNGENELKDRNQTITNTLYDDDWNNTSSEW